MSDIRQFTPVVVFYSNARIKTVCRFGRYKGKQKFWYLQTFFYLCAVSLRDVGVTQYTLYISTSRNSQRIEPLQGAFPCGLKSKIMAQYDVVHVEKNHGTCSSKMEQEEDRTEAVTRNADPRLARLNFSLHLNAQGRLVSDKLKWTDKTKQQRIDEVLAKQGTLTITDKRGRTYTKSAKIRKDAVTHFNLILSGSHETMMKMLADDVKNGTKNTLQWAADNWNWLAERAGGAENIVTFNVHCDETTTHIQATIVPMYNGRLNGKKFVDGSADMKALRTDHANRVGEKWGLERGVEGSKAEHQTLRQFYRDLHRGNVKDITLLRDILTEDDIAKLMADEQIPQIVGTPPVFGKGKWVQEQNEQLETAYNNREKKVFEAVAKSVQTATEEANKTIKEAISEGNAAISQTVGERNKLRTENSQIRAKNAKLEKQNQELMKQIKSMDVLQERAVQSLISFGKSRRTFIPDELKADINNYIAAVNPKATAEHRKLFAQALVIDCIHAVDGTELKKLEEAAHQIAADVPTIQRGLKI